MDKLILDSEVLMETADIVETYCNRQLQIIEAYLSQVSSLSSEWVDDKTFGTMIEEIRQLKNGVVRLMETIMTTYPKYFRERARIIADERPTMGNH